MERKIIIGLITSTDYLRQIRNIWDPQFIESLTAKRIASWCWEYFNKYDVAPGKEIETIYYSKLKGGKLAKDIAEEIEEEILPGLSKEYENSSFNLQYLLEESTKYFTERRLTIHSEKIQSLLAGGELTEAETIACDYTPITNAVTEDLDLGSPIVLDRIDKAFTTTSQPLIYYPRQLGKFWNSQLTRGGFVALMASEKRGKTFWLLDMAIRACKQGCKVAFFQAGDMTEDEQLIRICIYLTQRSDRKEYSGMMWESVRDCINNQLNDCNREERECDFGAFEGWNINTLKNEVTLKDLIKAYKEYPRYKTCHNCLKYWNEYWGAVWIKEVDTGNPLTADEAKKAVEKFFIKYSRHFKLSSHANGTLSVKEIRAILANWEKQDNFIPDVVVVDYADLLMGETREFRHLQNEIWKGLRRLSQEKGQPLVITATQADAKSYDQDRLRLSNFSEDKRKYGHVTALWGLQQDTKDREKKIGLMRINELVIRKGEFSNSNEIIILQNLKRGRPFLGSYK